MLIIPTKFPKSEIRAGGSGIFDIGRNFFRNLTQTGIKNLKAAVNSAAGKQVQNHLKKELETAAKKGTEQLIRKVKDTRVVKRVINSNNFQKATNHPVSQILLKQLEEAVNKNHLNITEPPKPRAKKRKIKSSHNKIKRRKTGEGIIWE